MLRTGSSTSYSTFTRRFAFASVASSSATTRQMASPTQRVTSPSAIITSQSWIRWPTWFTGTSLARRTPTTPGSASAFDVSMLTTRARGYFERTALA